MVTAWFTMIMGEVAGPLSSSQLVEMARRGELRIDDWVRRGTNGDWVRSENVIGLFDVPSLTVVVASSVAVIDARTALSPEEFLRTDSGTIEILKPREGSRLDPSQTVGSLSS